jgi:hypothetical protein
MHGICALSSQVCRVAQPLVTYRYNFVWKLEGERLPEHGAGVYAYTAVIGVAQLSQAGQA